MNREQKLEAVLRWILDNDIQIGRFDDSIRAWLGACTCCGSNEKVPEEFLETLKSLYPQEK